MSKKVSIEGTTGDSPVVRHLVDLYARLVCNDVSSAEEDAALQTAIRQLRSAATPAPVRTTPRSQDEIVRDAMLECEGTARQLLRRVGIVSETYDSARLMAALGHLRQAVDELHQAGLVVAAQVRHAAKDE